MFETYGTEPGLTMKPVKKSFEKHNPMKNVMLHCFTPSLYSLLGLLFDASRRLHCFRAVAIRPSHACYSDVRCVGRVCEPYPKIEDTSLPFPPTSLVLSFHSYSPRYLVGQRDHEIRSSDYLDQVKSPPCCTTCSSLLVINLCSQEALW